MNSNIKIPAWMVEGPDDIEYRTYKLRGTISDIKKKIADSNLMDALYAIDDALDYLYQYDAVKMTQDPNPMDQIVSGFEFPNLELVFTTDEEIETDEIIDLLLDEAIDSYENLHAACRENWRIIEENITCNYVPKKQYMLTDGFVFIKTADNKMHTYHFIKPNKYFANDWKQFKLTHINSEKWTDTSIFQT